MKPAEINFHKKSQSLELVYSSGESYTLSSEYLRVHSPSAEVQGHGEGQQVLQVGKRMVKITGIEPKGNYAIKLSFDDGHDTGIFTWVYLLELAQNFQSRWAKYLSRLADAGADRSPAQIQLAVWKPSSKD